MKALDQNMLNSSIINPEKWVFGSKDSLNLMILLSKLSNDGKKTVKLFLQNLVKNSGT